MDVPQFAKHSSLLVDIWFNSNLLLLQPMQQGTSLYIQYSAHVQLYLQDKFPEVGFLYKLKIIHL